MTVTATSRVATDRGERYRKQLASHFGNKVEGVQEPAGAVLKWGLPWPWMMTGAHSFSARSWQVLPPSLSEHPAAELSVNDSAQLCEDRRQPDHIA
jgi:hypothetical protein